MKDFDLDIRNYNIADLEHFFQIFNEPYTLELLENREREWMAKIAKLTHLDSEFKDAFRSFLQEGREALVREKLQPKKPPVVENVPKTFLKGPPEEIVRTGDADLYAKPIVSKPDLPFVYARNSEYFGGVLNPLEKHLTKRVVSIDSIFRENYAATTCSDFVFRFPEVLKNVACMELMSLELPVQSWYDVTEAAASNYFTLTFSGLTGYSNGSIFRIAIPDGNYTASEMVDAIQQSLQVASQGAQYILVMLDPSTMKFVFYPDPVLSVSGGPLYSPEFAFELNFMTRENNRMYENLGWKLGFRKYVYFGNLVTSIVGESAYVPFLDTYVYLEIDDFNRNNQSNVVIGYTDPNTIVGDNILARISLQELALQGVSQIFKRREYFGSVRLEKLRIRLLDRFGKPLQMNAADYSFALEIKQIYS